VPWISITSGASVTGSGAVSFDIASTATARSTILVVAGHNVDVVQR
jgi:hypothetical protein